MRVAIRPLPTIRVGDIRWWWRRRLRWMAARISRPVGISTAAQIHTRSTVCSVCPGTRPRVIRVSRNMLARATVASIGPISSRNLRLSRRRYTRRAASIPDDGGDVEQDHPQRWGGLVRLRHPPVGQERCHRRRQHVDGDRDDCAQRIQTDQAGEPAPVEDARDGDTGSRASVGSSRRSVFVAISLDSPPHKHRPQVTGTQGCHPGFICTFSLEMRGQLPARRFAKTSSNTFVAATWARSVRIWIWPVVQCRGWSSQVDNVPMVGPGCR